VSLRTRLVLAAAYLVTVAVVALVVPLALNVERRAASEFEAGVLGNAAILSARIHHLLGPEETDGAELDRLVSTTAGELASRVVITNATGEVIADSAGLAAAGTQYAGPQRPEFSVALFEGRIDTRRRRSESLGQDLLIVTVPVVEEGRIVGAVRVTRTQGELVAEVRRSWMGLALIGGAVLLAGVGLAWFLATTLARPVRRLRDAATRLGAGDLDARTSPEGPGELASLGSSFNRMADALSANLSAQQDFLANASHQLRTPLAGLKLRLEAIRRSRGSASEEASKAEVEVDRLAELVDDLLKLARTASVESTGSAVDLAEVIRQAADRWAAPAASAGMTLRVDPRASTKIWGDASDLSLVLDNLVENAIRYCPAGSTILLETTSSDGRATLSVADDGPGIPPDERPRLFERFYRGTSGRRSGPGTGLGLAVVLELVRRWGGEVRLGDGPGTRIEATFPVSPTIS
jgi:two-component system, OmpR family, sensor kinase